MLLNKTETLSINIDYYTNYMIWQKKNQTTKKYNKESNINNINS